MKAIKRKQKIGWYWS